MLRAHFLAVVMAATFASPDSARAAAPDRGSSRAKPTRSTKRIKRRGLPVLQSRPTSRTRPQTEQEAAKTTAPLVGSEEPKPKPKPAPDHVELTARKLADGNVTAFFTGWVSSGFPAILVTSPFPFTILYPIEGAAGRDLVFSCTGYFEGDLTVRSISAEVVDDKGVTTIWDELVVKIPANETKTSFKVLIDTKQAPKGRYLLQLTPGVKAQIERCTLDLLD